ncbi:MAG: hypothetical protein NT140_07100 [Deltaproteobacteria bacterium]|nr:hypothetical protein [Deltaproteobacteria bacterium]
MAAVFAFHAGKAVVQIAAVGMRERRSALALASPGLLRDVSSA